MTFDPLARVAALRSTMQAQCEALDLIFKLEEENRPMTAEEKTLFYILLEAATAKDILKPAVSSYVFANVSQLKLGASWKEIWQDLSIRVADLFQSTLLKVLCGFNEDEVQPG